MEIDLGVMAPPLGEQIDGLSEEDAERLDGHRQAIARLRIYEFITAAEADRARRKLLAAIKYALIKKGGDE